MKLIFLSDNKRIFEGEILKVSCLSDNGEIIIMDGHIPYLSKISNVAKFVRKDGVIEKHDLNEGFIYTNGKDCYVIVDS